MNRLLSPTMRHFLLVLFIVTAAKWFFVWGGWPEATLVADDAFYYFTIARNMAIGRGATFDGLAPTNGFHPLWALILAPVFAAAPGSTWVPIRIALSLGALFDAVTAILLFRLVAGIYTRRAAWVAALCWACAPTNAILTFLGMEGSLAAMLLVGLLAWILNIRARERAPKRHAIGTGVLWGLAGLARTDLLPLAGIVAAAATVQQAREWRARLRWFTLAAVTAGIVVSPWFGWNLKTFGTIEQTSGRAKRQASALYGQLPTGLDSPRQIIITGASRLFAPAVTVCGWLTWEEFPHQPDTWWPWLAGFWLVVASCLVVVGTQSLRASAARMLANLTIVFLASHVLLYGFVLGFYTPWYASSFNAIAAIPLGCALAHTRKRWLIPALSVLMFVQVALPVLHESKSAYVPGRRERYWMERLTKIANRYPDGVRIGLFDAGAAGYYSGFVPRTRVINLDGIVNNAALTAIESRRYPEYVAEHVDLMLQSVKRTRMFLDEAEYARLLELLEKQGFDMEEYR